MIQAFRNYQLLVRPSNFKHKVSSTELVKISLWFFNA